MPHFYPDHLDDFAYIGRHSNSLSFSTHQRASLLREQTAIDLVVTQFRRASREKGFVIAVHCIMPDHVHLIVDAKGDECDCRAFIKAGKQYSGYYYKQAHGRQLWQRYGYERILRNHMERALTIRYLLANPVRAGLVADPRRFTGLGSETHTIDELMQISEYSNAYVLE